MQRDADVFREQRRVHERSEIDPRDALERLGGTECHFARKACLATTARSGEREQACGPYEIS